jgi:hypothetical protein
MHVHIHLIDISKKKNLKKIKKKKFQKTEKLDIKKIVH